MNQGTNILLDEDFLIPVDDAIEEFMRHLWAHPRTILSAAYGDGKSFFLKKFAEHKGMQDNFVFLTLYPVNYQVVENKDIFDLIKYDLIFQLYDKGMLQTSSKKISTSILLYHYIVTHKLELTDFFCDAGSMVGVLPEHLGKLIGKGSKFIADWEKYKKEYGNGSAAIDRYYEKIDRHYLYEADSITAFIKETIAEYKLLNPGKKIVLVIEDMDRLDPAHLFRILNVFSAQVDYAYRNGISPDKASVAGNKFDVDNVLLVMDYENTKNIYHHFYGEKANFEGYINKFVSHNIFRYSLTQEKYKYFSDFLRKAVNVRLNLANEILPDSVYENKTIREINAAITNTEGQVFHVPQYNDINHSVGLPKEILQLMVVLRRLGTPDNVIAARIEQVITEYPLDMMYYLGGYWLLYKHKTLGESFYIPAKEKGNIYQISINDVLENGAARVALKEFMQISQVKLENMRDFVHYMLQFIAQ